MTSTTSGKYDEKILLRELEESKERAEQFERTARWWNESCVKWREKWGKENAEKKKLAEELGMLSGRNRALIVEFQRMQAENSRLNLIFSEQQIKNEASQIMTPATHLTTQGGHHYYEGKIQQPPVKTAFHRDENTAETREVSDEKRVARVEPIVEEVRIAKTMNNESPTFPPLKNERTFDIFKRSSPPLAGIDELDSLDSSVDGSFFGGEKR